MNPAHALVSRAGSISIPAATIKNLGAWWRKRVALAGLPTQFGDLRFAVEAQPPEPLDELNGDDSILDPWQLGSEYVGALDAAERALHGRHYTPQDLAEHLWAMTRKAMGFGVDDRALPGLLRDPAVGGGALLIAPLREHLRASSPVDPSLVLSSLPNFIEGIDNDPWAVYLANVVLAAEMLPTLARVPASLRRPLPSLVRVGDGLDPDLTPAHSWILNPPYGRQKLSPERRAQFADTLYGHANLYGLFIASTIGKTASDGAVGALVPTSFSAGLYFTRLRAELGKRSPLRSLMFVHERDGVFGGVLQETCLAVFTPRVSRRTTITRINGHVSAVAKVPTPRSGEPWLIPRESRDAVTAAAASSLPLTLGDVGWRASTGPLVWNRRRDDLHTRKAKNRARIVWAADIEDGTVRRARARDSMRYLALTTASDTTVMRLTEPAVLVQRTTAPEQTRRLVVAHLTDVDLLANDGAVVVENHVNVLRPTHDNPLLSHATLARVLASPTFDRLMRCISGSVAVSAYELEALPFPAADVLRGWDELGDGLEQAIEAAYRTAARE
ncbi:SAM-dependent methyltransferase [Homoserinimonas hongtaonis]|uniref:SAM-dependent methyltransferase n=1 Tax=Homoserinimonas hongtaonis TaxID=2079791 RepID=UPI000D354E8F|nr:SAM-dependent methyltransferase [Salinibacterium hongtaonis]AWB88749.1 SAM-dependent methyltransferase [Salinibacterium hongtaonis]